MAQRDRAVPIIAPDCPSVAPADLLIEVVFAIVTAVVQLMFAFQETDAILDTGMEPSSASKLKLSFIGGVGFSFPAG